MSETPKIPSGLVKAAIADLTACLTNGLCRADSAQTGTTDSYEEVKTGLAPLIKSPFCATGKFWGAVDFFRKKILGFKEGAELPADIVEALTVWLEKLPFSEQCELIAYITRITCNGDKPWLEQRLNSGSQR